MDKTSIVPGLESMSDADIMGSGYIFDLGGKKALLVDEDGFPVSNSFLDGNKEYTSLEDLQAECWAKYNKNPQVFTSVDDTGGSLAGPDFRFSSPYPDVHEFIEEIVVDSRNRLYSNFEKFVMRSEVEGELFLVCTVHEDGFVEIDFLPPSSLVSAAGTKGTILHPNKTCLPMGYVCRFKDANDVEYTSVVPSVYATEFPKDIIKRLKAHKEVKMAQRKIEGLTASAKYKELGGVTKFIIQWDKGLFTARNTSHLRTVIEWANHYEELKRYEIDHKKSSGAYLWCITFDDLAAFKRWCAMSDEERAKTGLQARKTPGGTLMVPPGMKVEVKNPNLSKISDQDTDIMEMVVSGLNSSEDTVTGSNKGTYASVKAQRGPESDRKSYKIERFRRFLIYDFWRHIFRVKNAMDSSFAVKRPHKVAVDFKGKKPVFKMVDKYLYDSMTVTFPVSEITEIESVAKALLGVKHGSLIDQLGIPPSVVARRLGFRDYDAMRLQHAVEDDKYPELVTAVDSEDAESTQENTMNDGENKKDSNSKSDKTTSKTDGDKGNGTKK